MLWSKGLAPAVQPYPFLTLSPTGLLSHFRLFLLRLCGQGLLSVVSVPDRADYGHV